METVLDGLDHGASLDARCRQLAELLELEDPVREEVMLAALADEQYARNLLTCRRAPALMEYLLANPPRHAPAPTSTVELARRAASAFGRWAMAGFSTVDEATYRRRLDACASCPHLKAPDTHQRLYRAVSGGAPPSVCGRCGCVVARKARLTSEHCPDVHPGDPALTRWGEPLPR